ncbi:hypothetical protein BSKO_11584 [Bryopsis sp. KO-2023]|nr:hypothetical protein BSKO_11584 [Bryopsis sp. KO-2023]
MAKPQVAKSFRASKPGMIPSRTVKRDRQRSCSNFFRLTDPSSSYLGRKAGKAYSYFINNHQRIAVVGLTLAFCVACFYWRFNMWANTPKQRFMTWSLPVAKGCGQAMKVTFSLILFPVSRNAVTWARYWGDKSRGDLYDLAFPDGPSQPSYWALLTSQIGITGVGIYLIMIIAYAFALDYPRRSKWIVHTKLGKVLNNFNYFWYTHHLFAFFYILLLLHPSPGIPDEANEWGVSDFWVWGGVPILVYIIERFLRLYRQRTWQTKVLFTESLPGNVMAMYISKPKRFRYKSGMYVFLNCPQLSQFEWHPYTMTSAPRDDFIGVHVAALGDWSSAINDMFSSLEVQRADSHAIHQNMAERTGSRCTPTKALLNDNNVEMSDNSSRPESNCSFAASSGTSFLTIVPDKMKVYVDGPYGAPAQDYEQYRVLLLVGAGIGITPFASMLRNMLNQFEEHRCMHCGKVTLNDSFKIRKIYFYWVVRDPQSAMWFNKELQALKNDDHSGILDINIHVTGVQKAEDVRSKLLQVVQKVYHDESGVDIITGGPATSLTKFGRPNWASVFKGIKSKHPRTLVGVFFCGQPLLGKQLGKHCREHTEKRGTKFEFLFERF